MTFKDLLAKIGCK